MKSIWRAEILYAIVACIALSMLLSVVLPFAPYKFYGHTNVPDKVCAGERVRFSHDHEVSSGWWFSADTLEISAYWENDEYPPYSNWTSKVPVVPTDGRTESPSPAIRRAPPDPGMWTPKADLVVWGKVLLTPRHQDLHISAHPIEVLPHDSSACENVSTEIPNQGEGP